MTVSTAERHAKIHKDALDEFDRIYSAQWPERLQCLEDRRFYSVTSAQWDGALGDQFATKPRFEFNKTHLAVMRVFNEYRANRINVDFVPQDGGEDDLADICDSLLRADEQACSADEAYDNAFEEGVGGGMGAWRLCAEYENDEDDEDERQRVRIEPIHDADTCVFFDLDAKRQDKKDAKRCYVLTPYSPEAYEEEFGDDPTTWPKPDPAWQFDWTTPEIVWVCEHYRVETRKETVRYFAGLDPQADEMIVTEADIEADPSLLDELAATGFREVRTKQVKRRVVRKYLLSGAGVIEDCGLIAGRHIPIIPFFGKRWVVDGVERCMGHVRIAKDAQRLTNMLMSWLAEMAARFDIEKPIFSPAQIAAHANMWANDNVEKFPYLLADPLKGADGQIVATGPVGYTKAPSIPPAMAALANVAEQALTDLLGNQQAGEEIRPNISGKAVELIQSRLDMQVYIYMSNFARAMKRAGEVWLSMMADIATEKNRRMKTIDASGKAGSVVLNQIAFDDAKAVEYVKNDMTKARLDVVADVGPSSASKRAATVRALTGMMQITDDPQTKQVLTAMAMMNMEGEGLSDVRDFFRWKMLRMGAAKPTEQEAKRLESEAQGAQPDPQALYLTRAAEAEQAKAAKARADTVDAIASADLKRAQTAKTLAETDGARQEQVFGAAEAIRRAAMPPDGVPGLG